MKPPRFNSSKFVDVQFYIACFRLQDKNVPDRIVKINENRAGVGRVTESFSTFERFEHSKELCDLTVD